ncbi:MAG: hypothetical protein U9N47_06520 [Thermodesulfobacteriota bacterium]|nr:hypothetical protein [Thermodesulfobacteriota bacterium]
MDQKIYYCLMAKNIPRIWERRRFHNTLYFAVKRSVSASTQNQALNAVVFLYKQVLNRVLGDFGNMQRAKRPKNIGEEFLVFVVATNLDASQVFANYLRNSASRNNWLGLQALPRGATSIDSVKVVRK